jgi:hypothetical protein
MVFIFAIFHSLSISAGVSTGLRGIASVRNLMFGDCLILVLWIIDRSLNMKKMRLYEGNECSTVSDEIPR